jgi:hypothetical protein
MPTGFDGVDDQIDHNLEQLNSIALNQRQSAPRRHSSRAHHGLRLWPQHSLQAGGLVISGGQFFNSRNKQIAKRALQHRVPTIFPYRDFAAAGGLMSYGASIIDAYRLAGIYTGRALKGEKPADLPVQQATKIELIINLETAKALGITVPLSLSGRADEVIE